MNSIEEFEKWCDEQKKTHPELAIEIDGILQLCKDEVEDGNSVESEIHLAKVDIELLISGEE